MAQTPPVGQLVNDPRTRALLERRAPEAVALYDGALGDPGLSLEGLVALPAARIPASHLASLKLEVVRALAGDPRPVWSTRSRVVDLMADPGAFPVMQRHIPRLVAQIEFGTGIQFPLDFTLENFLHVPESEVTRGILDRIQGDLDALNSRPD